MNSSIPEKPPEKTCRLCKNWERDQIGDGTGMGLCKLNINPAQLKWPNIPACSSYQGEGEVIFPFDSAQGTPKETETLVLSGAEA